jgi:large subunit ribosomal protein L32
MALPKQRTSKERQRKRRSHHQAATASIKTCSQCGSPQLNHHVCPTCGSYAGREVVEMESPKKKKSE